MAVEFLICYSSTCNSRCITETMNLHIIRNFIFDNISWEWDAQSIETVESAKFLILEQDQ